MFTLLRKDEAPPAPVPPQTDEQEAGVPTDRQGEEESENDVKMAPCTCRGEAAEAGSQLQCDKVRTKSINFTFLTISVWSMASCSLFGGPSS